VLTSITGRKNMDPSWIVVIVFGIVMFTILAVFIYKTK